MGGAGGKTHGFFFPERSSHLICTVEASRLDYPIRAARDQQTGLWELGRGRGLWHQAVSHLFNKVIGFWKHEGEREEEGRGGGVGDVFRCEQSNRGDVGGKACCVDEGT